MMHRSLAIAAAAALTTTVACAHDGHGAEQLHVHAGDVVGLLLALAGIGVVLWLRRK